MDKEEKQLSEQFSEVLDGLKTMAAGIEIQKFPGQAWPGRKRRGLRLVLWPAVAAGLAATVVIAIFALHNHGGNRVGPLVVKPPATQSGTDGIDNTAEYDLHVLEMIATDSSPSDEQLIGDWDEFWQSVGQTPASQRNSG